MAYGTVLKEKANAIKQYHQYLCRVINATKRKCLLLFISMLDMIQGILSQPRVSIRVIIRLESSQLPVGNRLFRVIDFTWNLGIKS